MSYSYKIYKDQNLNIIKASDVVYGSEVFETMEKMFDDPDWKYVKKQINDFLDVKELVVTEKEFEKVLLLEQKLSEKNKQILDGKTGKLAIVANKELYKILFNLYAYKTKGLAHTTKIFDTIDDAFVWINESENFNDSPTMN